MGETGRFTKKRQKKKRVVYEQKRQIFNRSLFEVNLIWITQFDFGLAQSSDQQNLTWVSANNYFDP